MMSKRSFVRAGLWAVGLVTTLCVGQNPFVRSAAADSDDSGGGYLQEMVPSGRQISFRDANRSNIRRLTEELREAGDEKKKAEITKQLQSVVGDIFDMDLKGREAELSKLE